MIHSIFGWLVLMLFSSYLMAQSAQEKLRVITDVGENIARTIGDSRQAPQFKLDSYNQLVIAQFKAEPIPTIVVSEKAYDVCASFKADSLHALACLLGHELAHYYNRHLWDQPFAESFGFYPEKREEFQNEQQRMVEAQADYYGTFYGFLAGYQTYRLMPDFVKKLYHSFHLSDTLTGYPSLKKRLDILHAKLNEISVLIQAARAGEFLLLVKDYSGAQACFQYVLSHFPSKDVYNYAGLAFLLEATEYLERGEMLFSHPFLLDPVTQLEEINTLIRGDERSENKDKKDVLLGKAYDCLAQAIAIDPMYQSGHINLASTYILQGNNEAAVGLINTLEMRCRKQQMSLNGNAHLVRGIARTKLEQYDRAYTNFKQARRQGSSNAEYNYTIFQQYNSNVFSWDRVKFELKNWLNTYFPESEAKATNLTDFLSLPPVDADIIYQDTILIDQFGSPVQVFAHGRNVPFDMKIRLSQKTYYVTSQLLITPEEKFWVHQPDYTMNQTNGGAYYAYKKRNLLVETKGNTLKRTIQYKVEFN